MDKSDPFAVGKSRRTVLLYGDVNLNIIDGSAIWLLSMVEALSRTNSHVTVLLKANVNRPGFLDRIATLDNVDIVQPFVGFKMNNQDELSPTEAVQRLSELDDSINVDVLICRGSRVCGHIADLPHLICKSWLYMTDIPHPLSKISEKRMNQIRKIVSSCKRMFAQTRDAQSYLEAIAPEACGKTLILSPMVPDEYYAVEAPVSLDSQLRLVYSGKFATAWRTLEMCDLPVALGAAGFRSTLTMVGDKFHNDRVDASWSSRMQSSIHNDGVHWRGGMSRDDASNLVAKHDVSLSWRSLEMNDSFEISTKVLESAALGVPPLVNRNAAHEELLGADYPLFLNEDSASEVVKVLGAIGSVSFALREQVRKSVADYSISASSVRLERYFRSSEPNYDSVPKKKVATRVLLVSHDFKFAGELVDLLAAREDIELRFDRWPSLHKHDHAVSEGLNEWADVVICEWAGPNAVWYSQNKRVGQKLIVRLHMFELRGPWLSSIDVTAIDKLICVSELYKERVRAVEGMEDANIRVIPNAVDSLDLLRPKLKGSQFRLGLVGIVPIRKRLDRAVDLMRDLLDRDERYTLHVRGRMPWEYDYEWKKPTQQMAYRQIFSDIGADETLRNAIVFEPFGADMGSWMRKIGFVLSPSSDESFHLAPAEGMASGSVPVLWDRPGVGGIFGDRWTVNDTEGAANLIHSLSNDSASWDCESATARVYAERFGIATVSESWLEEIL